ncbi:hypothetical protein [Aeoliella sp.]|uniref:hypothetical protein n=1 Tax=Aeoliella sp. TaxID=2795800 RepID=UPI003CCC19BD
MKPSDQYARQIENQPPKSNVTPPTYLPTPEEIAERCAEFRRLRPRKSMRPRYSFPVLSQL